MVRTWSKSIEEHGVKIRIFERSGRIYRDVALERTVSEFGFRGAFVRPNPYAGRPIHHPCYEPFWACAASLGVALTVHEGVSDSLPTLGRDRTTNPAVLHLFSHPFE